MNKVMKISVITVCFNSAASIAATLDSVASQTHPAIEHIVIDGGSKDSTLAIISEHGKHVSHLVSEPDKGIYDAMNKGLLLAQGDVIGFINSDDFYASPAALANLARVFSDPLVAACYGDLVYIDPRRQQPLVRYWRAGNFSKQKLRRGWMPPHPTLYVRRSVFNSIGPFDATLKIAADYEFILRLLSTDSIKVAYLPEVLVKMRVGGASNQSISALILKSREDLGALRKHRVGGLLTLLLKNLRKLPQFVRSPKR